MSYKKLLIVLGILFMFGTVSAWDDCYEETYGDANPSICVDNPESDPGSIASKSSLFL